MTTIPFLAFLGVIVWVTVVAIAFVLVFRLVKAVERIADALERETRENRGVPLS
jgi:hypothetical protein